MNCIYCGNPLSDDDRFCTRCGRPVQATPVQPAFDPTGDAPEPKPPFWSTVGGKILIAVLAVVFVGLAVLTGFAAASMIENANQKQVESAEESSKHQRDEDPEEEELAGGKSERSENQEAEETSAASAEEASEETSTPMEESEPEETSVPMEESEPEETSTPMEESQAEQSQAEQSQPEETTPEESSAVPEEAPAGTQLPDPFGENVAYTINETVIEGETLAASAAQGRAHEWLISFFEGGPDAGEEEKASRTAGMDVKTWLVDIVTFKAADAAGWGQPWLQALAWLQSSPAVTGAAASSELDESDLGLDHSAAMVYDGTMTNAWCEGVSGYGVGEWVRLEYDAGYAFSSMEIYAGYHKSSQLYYENSRPQEILIVFEAPDGSTTSETIVLEDVMEVQNVSFEQLHYASRITISIQSTYNGTEFDDTLITEVAFH